MALCGEERNEWFWKLPMALLAIRTTLKPDIGASPADLVYGEGLAVPGDLLPNYPNNETEDENHRRTTLANLRLEVERLIPKPTSAHRQPNVHIPDDLESATHVMVRRGGVNPPLTQPFQGPYQVHSRTETGIKVHLPGRGVEEVALARVKPAVIEAAEQPNEDNNNAPPAPPDPPQPQQPNQPTRLLNPTRRATRQNARQTAAPTPTQSTPQLDPDVFDDDSQDDTHGGTPHAAETSSTPPPESPPIPPPTSSQEDEGTSYDPGEGTSGGANRLRLTQPALPTRSAPGKRTLSFSNPQPGHFSYRRRKPDVNALRAIIESLNA